MNTTEEIQIAVVDDHQLFREGLIGLIEQLDPRFKVILEANNGQVLIDQLEKGLAPDLILLDLNMPILDGLATVKHLQEHDLKQKCLVLTMRDDELTLIQLLKAGAKGFLNKDVESEELKKAILSVHYEGVYHSEFIAGVLVNSLQQASDKIITKSQLNEQELRFIELACSEYTYKEIADIMCLSSKTIDGYRGRLFEKLNLKSRVGLVLYAIQNKIISMD